MLLFGCTSTRIRHRFLLVTEFRQLIIWLCTAWWLVHGANGLIVINQSSAPTLWPRFIRFNSCSYLTGSSADFSGFSASSSFWFTFWIWNSSCTCAVWLVLILYVVWKVWSSPSGICLYSCCCFANIFLFLKNSYILTSPQSPSQQ